MITAPISLVLHIYIRLTKSLQNGTLNAKFDTKRKLYPGFTDLDWNDNAKIEEAITVNKYNKDEEKDPRKKNRPLKREKQC